MGVFIPVDIADFLNGARHFAVSSEVVKKHEAGVEINPFQDKVGNADAEEAVLGLFYDKLVVEVSDKFISAQQMRVGFPLIEDVISFGRVADGIQHVAVALAVDTFLKSLDGQAEVHFVGGDILRDIREVCRLEGIQIDKEAEDLVIGSAFLRCKVRVVALILVQVNFLRYPEVVHRLSIPVGNPFILHIIKVIDIGRVEIDEPPVAYINVPFRVKQGLAPDFFHGKVLSV